MKHFIILLFALSFSLNSHAYRSIFGENSTTWIIEYHLCIFDNIIDSVYFEKDTVVYGVNYKKITGIEFNAGGLIREDTVAGKVWFKSLYMGLSQSDTMEVLAFDFSLQKGDTFDIWNQNYAYFSFNVPDSLKIVDTVYYKDGLKHIQFKHPHNSYLPDEPLEIIEGIGSNYSVLWKQFGTCFNKFYLRCSYKEGIKMPYINKSANGDCGYLNIHKFNNVSSINIYPVPTSSLLKLEMEHFKVDIVTIYDLQGRIQFSSKISNNIIDVSMLENGQYSFEIVTNNGETFSKKIIIQH